MFNRLNVSGLLIGKVIVVCLLIIWASGRAEAVITLGAGEVWCGDRMTLYIENPGGCASNWADPEPGKCVGAYAGCRCPLKSSGCYAATYSRICQTSCPESRAEQDSQRETTVTNVAVGSEDTAAAQTWDTESAILHINAGPIPEGWFESSSIDGMSWVSTPTSDPAKVNLLVSSWYRRGVSKVQGDTVPLGGSIGSGAIDGQFGNSSMTNDGSTGSPIEAAGWASFDESLPVIEAGPTIGDRIAAFVSNNPIVGIFTGSHITVSGAVCTLSGEIIGKEVSVDFCQYETWLNTMGTILMLVSTIYAFYLAWGA